MFVSKIPQPRHVSNVGLCHSNGAGRDWLRQPTFIPAGAALGLFRCAARGWRYHAAHMDLAEGVGFEPTGPFGPPVFKTGAIDHSATPPDLLPLFSIGIGDPLLPARQRHRCSSAHQHAFSYRQAAGRSSFDCRVKSSGADAQEQAEHPIPLESLRDAEG